MVVQLSYCNFYLFVYCFLVLLDYPFKEFKLYAPSPPSSSTCLYQLIMVFVLLVFIRKFMSYSAAMYDGTFFSSFFIF